MGLAIDLGTGTTISFATSGFTAQIVGPVRLPSMARGDVQTTHMGTTTGHTFMPTDLYDAGELTFDIHFNPGTNPPVTGSAETITVTLPGGDTWVFSGYMKSYEAEIPLEDKMTASVTVKVSGNVAITSA